MKLFRYLFYRLYQLMISVGNGFVAEYYAIFLMTMTIMLNFYTISSIVYLISPQMDFGLNSTTQIVTVAAILTIIFYFSFVYKKKYLEIAKSYELESDKSKSTGKLAAISYIVLSFLLLFFFVYLMAKKNRGEL